MENSPQKPRVTLLNKVIYFLFGLFISTFLFAMIIKILQTTGIWIGLIANIILAFIGLKYSKKNSPLKIISIGIIATVVIGIILYFVALSTIENSLEGL